MNSPGYRDDWERYNYYWPLFVRQSVKEGDYMFVTAVEDDGGSTETKYSSSFTVPSSSGGPSITLGVEHKYGSDDETLGSTVFNTISPLPNVVGLGIFYLEFDDTP